MATLLALSVLGGLGAGPALAEEEPDSTAAAGDESAEAGDGAPAEFDDSEDEDETPRCVGLLGNDDTREDNQARREALFVRASWSEPGLWILHRSDDWEEPKLLVTEGLSLAATELDDDGEWQAVLELDDDFAVGHGCEPGPVLAGVDDALGADGQVLAVLRDVVLIEVSGELAFLYTDDEDWPEFRMAWQAPWRVLYHGDPGHSGSKSKSRKKSRRKKKRR